MKIPIPIYFNTDETSLAEKAGIDVSLKDCVVKTVNFYNITCVSDYDEEGKTISAVHAGGDRWISPLTKEEIDTLIIMFKYN